MSVDLTFKDVCSFIKKDEPHLIESIDKLLALPLLCSPFFMDGLALLPLLTAKNEITKLTKGVFDAFIKKQDTDYIVLQRRMTIAYGLISFTAFFDALDRQLPAAVRGQINLKKEERAGITKDALKQTGTQPDPDTDRFSLIPITFPHPTETFQDQQTRLNDLYRQMAHGFKDFVSKLALWEAADEKTHALILNVIEKLPEAANNTFEAQYFALTRRFEDFAVWANLHEHKRTKQLIDSLSDYVKHYTKLSQDTKANIDVGLTKLHDIVTRIPETLKLQRADEIVEGLKRHYLARINEPILEHRDDGEEPPLSFPRVADAFVPQSYRVLRHGTKAIALEDEETWKDRPRRDDLGAFLLSYLTSPYSLETPLVILGHPGSGKSLLTTVISAQLLSSHFTAIRVPLREVNSDAGVVAQIEEHIGRVTHVRLDSWAKVSSAFTNNPPIVILDGYDELLQASGKVFAGYLKDVQAFQKNETEQGRPVRVIVTSRVTLIDKAIIPSGSTIVRLLEFDKRQRARWISIWNATNTYYFEKKTLTPFSLPDDDEADAGKILLLAEQPLLLLMLALYDSDHNSLREGKIRDKTLLYDSLLRRFIERERSKAKQFRELSSKEKLKEIDSDMQRLGVAAIGMYNRRKLHILTQELNDDLKFFDLERSIKIDSGRALTQADLLLGSFFFVHKSTATQKTGPARQHEETAAFEFLHNTFGEFLTADFIIRQALMETTQLKALGGDDALRRERDRKLNNADGLSRAWFACLVYTPLFTRPVVLEMIREWIRHTLRLRKFPKAAFLAELNDIIRNQIERVLTKRDMPSIMQKDEVQEGFRAPFGFHPLVGHLAIYSINLILLRTMISETPFTFDEGLIMSHEDGARPWDQLSHLWRSWFSIDVLNGVSAVLTAERRGAKVEVRSKDRLSVAEGRSRLETLCNMGLALGDNIVAGISAFMLYRGERNSRMSLDEVGRRLSSENIDVELEIELKRLNSLVAELASSADGIDEIVARFDQALSRMRGADWTAGFADLIFLMKRFLYRLSLSQLNRAPAVRFLKRSFVDSLSGRAFYSLVSDFPDAAITAVEIVMINFELDFDSQFERRFIHDFFHPQYFRDVLRSRPEVAIALLERLQESGFERIFEELPRLIEDLLEEVAQNALEWTHGRPDLIVALLELVRRFGTARWRAPFIKDLLRSGLERLRWGEWIVRNPERALNFFNFLREVGGEEALVDHLARRSVDEVLHQMPLELWMRENPKSIFNVLEIAMEFGLPHLTKEFIEAAMSDSDFIRWLPGAVRNDPSVALKLLRVMREHGYLRDTLIQHLLPIFADLTEFRRLLLAAKLGSLADLEWLAGLIGDTSFRQTLDRFKTGLGFD
jgi:hypothetical protein